MIPKSTRIADDTRDQPGVELDARYLGYFERFNRELYYEAHEVLEKLWLPDRQGPDAAFYKGLIQLAGAFVHLQKSRPGPAASLFKLAQTNLRSYPPVHKDLSVAEVLELIDCWLSKVQAGSGSIALAAAAEPPRIRLLGEH